MQFLEPDLKIAIDLLNQPSLDSSISSARDSSYRSPFSPSFHSPSPSISALEKVQEKLKQNLEENFLLSPEKFLSSSVPLSSSTSSRINSSLRKDKNFSSPFSPLNTSKSPSILFSPQLHEKIPKIENNLGSDDIIRENFHLKRALLDVNNILLNKLNEIKNKKNIIKNLNNDLNEKLKNYSIKNKEFFLLKDHEKVLNNNTKDLEANILSLNGSVKRYKKLNQTLTVSLTQLEQKYKESNEKK